VRGKALLAQRLDPAAGKLVGDAIPLGPEFPSNVGTSGQRAFSAGGDALAFHLGAPSQNRLVWTDRAGVEQQAVYDRPADWIFYPRLAPDGRRIALVVYRQNETGNIWVLDPARSGETPMTREGDNQAAVWSRSGRELAILTFGKGGESAVLRADSEKPQSARVWKAVPGLSNVDSWEAGDHGVLLSVTGAETGSDIWELSDSGDMRAVVATRATEHSGEASPDGRWLAYVSDVGGREDVYVAPISGQGSPWKVSTGGGYDPRWRPDGGELFFIAPGGRLQAVETTLGSTFTAGAAQTLFSAHFDASANRAYDVAKDGRRFLVNLSKASPGSPIVVVLGLGEEIRTRAARLSAAR
jgi:Tol biopolymer transport system component